MIVVRAVRLKCCPAGKKAVGVVALNNGSVVWIDFFDHITVKLVAEQVSMRSGSGRRAVVIKLQRQQPGCLNRN